MFKKLMCIFIPFIIICTFLFTGCSSVKNKNLDNNVDEIYKDIEGTNLYEYIKKDDFNKSKDNYLKANNITIDKIKEKLAVSKDVIPFDGEKGGTPFIVMESIKLIGDQWIYCTAEDGHVSAELIIKFVINKDDVQFKVCAIDFNDEGTKIINK